MILNRSTTVFSILTCIFKIIGWQIVLCISIFCIYVYLFYNNCFLCTSLNNFLIQFFCIDYLIYLYFKLLMNFLLQFYYWLNFNFNNTRFCQFSNIIELQYFGNYFYKYIKFYIIFVNIMKNIQKNNITFCFSRNIWKNI